VKHVEITKEGITRWFLQTKIEFECKKIVRFCTPDDAQVVRNILNFLSQFTPPSLLVCNFCFISQVFLVFSTMFQVTPSSISIKFIDDFDIMIIRTCDYRIRTCEEGGKSNEEGLNLIKQQQLRTERGSKRNTF
jgi:hypothetical protein